ncbi:MAG: hypothetical protein AAB874_00165 [Patescibacteria group bacterium]
MPTFLLIGIPIAVAVLLWGILSLPDEEEKKEPEAPSKPQKKTSRGKK